MSGITIPDIIRKKRDGGEHTAQEIQAFVDAVVDQKAEPAQIGAWLMAAYIRGLTNQEATHLTGAMMNSGDLMTWPEGWKGNLVDKHSTGGVGDKVSLILAPALAACGVKVPKISGRGLEHTGGTLDKLEAIPGYTVNLSSDRLREIVSTVGCCIAGQTVRLVPAEKRLYEIRDITGTVDSCHLAAGSIISKKAAEGISSLILDVKTGNGAFMKQLDKAEELAKLMVDVGCGLGIRTAALISSMDSPLGRAVGHSLEVAESVHCLQGKGPQDLLDLVVDTGGLLLQLAGEAQDQDKGKQRIRDVLQDGKALAKFKAMIVAQGVTEQVAADLCDVSGDVWNVLTPAAQTTILTCPRAGYIQTIRAMPCAKAVQALGAGRTKAGEPIDLTVGIYFLASLGDEVKEGTPWVKVHHTTPELPAAARSLLEEALHIVPKLTSPSPSSRVIKVIQPSL
ncbi:thymidine phosphorylase-like [Babylonia areolata]|uniref:thymidine phosphorylase-like n=1 Tax=Babylonia areolata TaxID=304850 RepID=UPI003FD47DD3